MYVYVCFSAYARGDTSSTPLYGKTDVASVCSVSVYRCAGTVAPLKFMLRSRVNVSFSAAP